MNTDVMMKRIAEASPRLTARMAGLFELLEALTSGFGQVIVPGMLVVSGNAAATAANLLAHGSLFRLSILAALIGVGESSGRLSEMVLRAGDLAAREAERLLDLAITLVEPCLVVVFGGAVAFVAAAEIIAKTPGVLAVGNVRAGETLAFGHRINTTAVDPATRNNFDHRAGTVGTCSVPRSRWSS